jgi:hypothetical protein
LTHDENSLNKDTLRFYYPKSSNPSVCWLQTNAFEIFKSSGIMRLMDNRELLMDIWDIYAGIDWLKEQIVFYNERQWDELNKEMTLQFEKKPMQYKARLYKFYAPGAAFTMRDQYERRLENLNYLLSELEKELSPNHK